jgi:hypothetical protein
MAQVPMNGQSYIGRGIDTSTGKVFRVAIEYDEIQPVTTGQQTTMMLQSITSSYELATTLSISASASASNGVWSGSASFNMMKSRTVNNYYTYALVKVEVVNPARSLRNPRLTQEAEKKLKEQGWDAFFALYGSEYIEGEVTGGTYYAMIEFQTSTESQQQDVRLKLSGAYGSFNASVSLQATFKEISKTTAHNVFVIQSGGSGDVLETTLDKMIEQAVNFPLLAKEHPVPVFALTNDYKSTVNLPNVPPPNSLLRIRQRDLLKELDKRYLQLLDYKSSVQFVLDHLIEFDDFRGLTAEQLGQKRAEFKKSLEDTANDIDMIVNRATRCTDDATLCETYVPTATILPLPTIGGKLMTIKQLEDRLNALQNALNATTTSLNNTRQELGQARTQVTQVQQQANSTDARIRGKVIVSGDIAKNYLSISHPIGTGNPEGPRSDTIHVNIPSGKFNRNPTIVIMLNSIELYGSDKHKCISVRPVSITSTGFDVIVDVWSNARIHKFRATWIAYTE